MRENSLSSGGGWWCYFVVRRWSASIREIHFFGTAKQLIAASVTGEGGGLVCKPLAIAAPCPKPPIAAFVLACACKTLQLQPQAQPVNDQRLYYGVYVSEYNGPGIGKHRSSESKTIGQLYFESTAPTLPFTSATATCYKKNIRMNKEISASLLPDFTCDRKCQIPSPCPYSHRYRRRHPVFPPAHWLFRLAAEQWAQQLGTSSTVLFFFAPPAVILPCFSFLGLVSLHLFISSLYFYFYFI